MSGLTKKVVYADRVLSAVLGVSEGALVSYADISKGIHKYIKEHDLKNPQRQEAPQATAPDVQEPKPATSMKRCRDCGAEIPFEAAYCDLCGVTQ